MQQQRTSFPSRCPCTRLSLTCVRGIRVAQVPPPGHHHLMPLRSCARVAALPADDSTCYSSTPDEILSSPASLPLSPTLSPSPRHAPPLITRVQTYTTKCVGMFLPKCLNVVRNLSVESGSVCCRTSTQHRPSSGLHSPLHFLHPPRASTELPWYALTALQMAVLLVIRARCGGCAREPFDFPATVASHPGMFH